MKDDLLARVHGVDSETWKGLPHALFMCILFTYLANTVCTRTSLNLQGFTRVKNDNEMLEKNVLSPIS